MTRATHQISMLKPWQLTAAPLIPSGPEHHPCLYDGDGDGDGDGDNSLEIYFESKENRQPCLRPRVESYPKTLCSDDSEDYMAEGKLPIAIITTQPRQHRQIRTATAVRRHHSGGQ